MTDTIVHPYAALTPDLILSAVESTGLFCSGSLLPLNSFENRVYQIGIEEEAPLIAKFYRPNRWSTEAILEEHAFAQLLVEHELPVIAPLQFSHKTTLHHYKDFRFALFKREGGHALELGDPAQLAWIGRFIGRLHAVGACQSFKHRIHFNVQTQGVGPFHYLIDHDFIPPYLKDQYCQVVTELLQEIERIFKEVGPLDMIRLHGDCHVGNILWKETGPHIVDLDDCLMGPAIQDLWMLLSGDANDIQGELDILLNGYLEFHDFNFRELHLIEVMRSLRLIQYAGWLARRWGDPAFPLNFPWFNTPHYWQSQFDDLKDQLMLLKELSLPSLLIS